MKYLLHEHSGNIKSIKITKSFFKEVEMQYQGNVSFSFAKEIHLFLPSLWPP